MTLESTTGPIGRVVATEQKPSTPHQFYFWAAEHIPVGIGAIVRVETADRTVHAVVTDGATYADLQSAIQNVESSVRRGARSAMLGETAGKLFGIKG